MSSSNRIVVSAEPAATFDVKSVLANSPSLEPNPVNLDARLARVSGGVHRLDGQLMVILDVDSVLNASAEPLAA